MARQMRSRWDIARVRCVAGALALIGALVATACAGPAAQPSGRSQMPAPGQPSRTLSFGVRAEPNTVASVALRYSGRGDRPTNRMFNAGLVLQDPLNVPHPYLAQEVPQLNTDTWRLLPDGRMETIYRLKPNLSWHDGHALSAADFVFSWEVFSLPEFAVGAASPLSQMEDVLAPDESTVLIRWRTSYPEANAVYDDVLPPLPRHILEAPFRQGGQEAFIVHPFWAAEYVGAGPFSLTRWEPGAFIEGTAFQAHVLGRPKIDRIQVRFIPDENAVLANMLAGELVASFAPRYEQAIVLQQHWEPNHGGTAVLIPTQPRFMHAQLRPEFANPRAVMDLRVRRALAHAIDKPSLDESLFGGRGAVTDSFLTPRTPYYADVDKTIAKYPYDLRRTEQLLNQAGFSKADDGFYAGPEDGRLILEVMRDGGNAYERELAAMADGWRQAGIDTRQSQTVAVNQMGNSELRNSFPAFYSTATGSGGEDNLGSFTTASIPTPANRWNGNNRSAWPNAEYDALWTAFNSTLDRSERNRQAVQMARLLSEELPIIMLYHNFHVVAYQSALRGPDTRGIRDLTVWNVHEWEMS